MKIIKADRVENVHRERDILSVSNHPNIIHLQTTFSNDKNLYFLLEYAENRSLSELLKQVSKRCLIKNFRAFTFGVDKVLRSRDGFSSGIHTFPWDSTQRSQTRKCSP
jgi:serine/threonine protein kinase